jgi:hypothetical protein
VDASLHRSMNRLADRTASAHGLFRTFVPMVQRLRRAPLRVLVVAGG